MADLNFTIEGKTQSAARFTANVRQFNLVQEAVIL